MDHRFMVIPASHTNLGVGVTSYAACHAELQHAILVDGVLK